MRITFSTPGSTTAAAAGPRLRRRRRRLGLTAPILILLAVAGVSHSAPLSSLPRSGLDSASKPDGEPEPLRALLARLQEERSRVHLKYRSVSSASRTGGTTSRRRRSSKASETPITAAAANSTTSVTLATQGRSVLFAPTTVGTPATTFLLAVDTTASDLWIITDVWGDDPNDPALLAETYGPNATRSPADLPTPPSSSFRSTNHTFSSAAVNGPSIWQGFQGTDIVKFAGRRLDDAAINIDTDSSVGAPAFPAVGVLGFGWQALANARATPFWQATGANIFSLHLLTAPNVTKPYTNAGTLYLGPPPEPAPEPSANASSPYTGPIDYFPLLANHTSTWSIGLTALTVSNASVSLNSSSTRPARKAIALIDSASNTLAVPDAVASAFYSHVPQAEPVPLSPGFWWYPCNRTDAIPQPIEGREPLNVTLSFDASHHYVIPDGLFGFPTTVPASGKLNGFDGGDSSSATFELDGLVKCIGALYGYGNLTTGNVNSTTLAAADSDDGRGGSSSSTDVDGDLFIIGLPFLRSVFTVFDGTKPAIGFAQLADPPLSESSLARGDEIPSWLDAYQAHQPDDDGDGTPDALSGSGTGGGAGNGGGGARSGVGRKVGVLGTRWGVSLGMAVLGLSMLCSLLYSQTGNG